MTETPNPHIIDADTLTGEMRPIRQLVVSLGSNLGERFDNLQVLSIAPLLAQAIDAVFEDGSVSELFGGDNV